MYQDEEGMNRAKAGLFFFLACVLFVLVFLDARVVLVKDIRGGGTVIEKTTNGPVFLPKGTTIEKTPGWLLYLDPSDRKSVAELNLDSPNLRVFLTDDAALTYVNVGLADLIANGSFTWAETKLASVGTDNAVKEFRVNPNGTVTMEIGLADQVFDIEADCFFLAVPAVAGLVLLVLGIHYLRAPGLNTITAY